MSALATYQQLLAKVDAKFEEIRARHRAQLACRAGCHGCCKPGLTVSPIERDAIRAFLLAHPERQAELEALEAEDPHGGARCRLLRADGGCAIYEVRPVVCRSHGVPLKVRLEGQVVRDVCPLNFEGHPLEQLEGTDFIDLDTLNTLLALLNTQHRPQEGLSRTPLQVGALVD